MANPTPEHVVENNAPRADTVRDAFRDLYFINQICQEYEKNHLLGYYSRSPNNNYLKNIIKRLKKVTNELEKAKEL